MYVSSPDDIYECIHISIEIFVFFCGIFRLFAFFLAEFILAQSIIILFTALNAFIMVVKERKIHLGKYDWRLLVAAFGTTAIVLTIGAILQFLGPSGPW